MNLGKTSVEDSAGKDKFVCTKCKQLKSEGDFHLKRSEKRRRHVASWCKECRKIHEDRNKNKVDTICIGCLKHEELNLNGFCKKCNKSKGLKECYWCGRMLLEKLHFYPQRSTCITCYRNV